ncbi:MAG: SpoIIE family protein phosphatase [Raineya sp.]|jgi:serine phosphatase RsbU (regulator of sigma subunit)|nr:SpoIIE family protein phosphatase [Raineya sp.]
MLRKINFILLFCIYIFSLESFGQQKIFEIPAEFSYVNISKFLYVFEDSTKKMDLKDILAIDDNRLKNIKTDDPTYGFKKSNFWIKVTLKNTQNSPQNLFLEFDYPLFDRVDIFSQDTQGNWINTQKTIGDKVPFKDRTIFYRNSIFNINLIPQETRTYFLKIDTESSIQFPTYLYASKELSNHISNTEMLFGMFYGILLIMGIYNLVLYFAIQNRSYLYYFVYIFFYGLAQASLNGHSFQHLWPNSLWWANAVVPIGLTSGSVGAILFMISFLNTEKYLPRFNKVIWGFVMLFTGFTLLGFFLEYRIAVKIGTATMVFLGFFELIVGLVVWRAGNRSAGYFVVSWAFFLIGVSVLAIMSAGLLPNHPFLRVFHLIGAMFQVVGLSFALADRVNIIRKEKEKAQVEALKATEENARIILEQNEMLENKVEERTRELQQKQEEILVQNEELHQQREEIMAQRDFIERKNNELVELNQHMSQSIQYASQIQKAILPQEEIIKNNLQDFFVIYLPKDVVSGDFYWYSKIDNKQFFAAVDCTGHGVPGAFMSMIGNTLLNKIINENKVYSPSKILDMLNEGVISSLKQKETGNNDGMDVCLCCVEEKSNGQFLVTFAGARRPLYIFKDNEIIELRGSRNHIGGSSIGITQTPFEDSIYILDKGDVVYLSTDGFVDNPNPNREKFGVDKFKTLLLLYGKETMNKQKSFLMDELKTFQKTASQRDDILVLGVKL